MDKELGRKAILALNAASDLQRGETPNDVYKRLQSLSEYLGTLVDEARENAEKAWWNS